VLGPASVIPLLAVVAAPPIDDLLTQYLREPAQRAELLGAIETAADGRLDAVAAALPRAALWPEQPPGLQETAIPDPTGEDIELSSLVVLPHRYDPRRAYPLILSYHGRTGTGRRQLGFQPAMMPLPDWDHIAAYPTNPLITDKPRIHLAYVRHRRVLDAIVRRFHVDTRRVYVTGYSKGGNEALMMPMLYPDRFAGAIPLAGMMHYRGMPYIDELLLPNLRHVPVHHCWGAGDGTLAPDDHAWYGGIASYNRRMRTLVERRFKDLPYRPKEYPDRGHGGITPDMRVAATLLATPRADYPRQVSKTFRSLEEACCYWLEVTRLAGEPWDFEFPPITHRPGLSAAEIDAARTRGARAHLQSVLPHVEGRIDGQRIVIETRNVAAFRLLLADAMVDLDRPVRVFVNRRQRFVGRVPRRTVFMLDRAAETWEFYRVFANAIDFDLVDAPGRLAAP